MCSVLQRRQRTVELKRLTLHHKHALALMLELLALTLELLPHLEMLVPEQTVTAIRNAAKRSFIHQRRHVPSLGTKSLEQT